MALFDPTAPAERVFDSPVELSEEVAHQQAAFDAVTGQVYVTQVIESGRQLPGESAPLSWSQRSARGDLSLSRVGADGTLLDNMFLRRFDHGAGLWVEHDAYTGGVWVWVAYDAAEVAEGSNAHGRLLARFRYQAGAVLDVGDAGIEVYDPVPGGTLTASVDAPRDRIAVNARVGGQSVYRIYQLSEFRERRFTPIIEFPVIERENLPRNPVYQSFTLWDGYIYEHRGTYYSASNPPPGNAYFVIMNAADGRLVRIVRNDHAPDLDRREPEAMTVWDRPDGPVLVFGFSISSSLPRLMDLYQVGPDTGPGTFITAEAVDGAGIVVTLSIPDRASVRSWEVTRMPGSITLFEGDGEDLPPDGSLAHMLDSSPLECRPVFYHLRVDYTDRPAHDSDSIPVTYTPEGGCQQQGGAVTESAGVLGCASEYTARIHWRGGARPFPLQVMDQLADVTWSRTLNDVSEATVTLAELCGPDVLGEGGEMEDLHPWVHELTIYRDGDLVWQGPVIEVRGLADAVIIRAVDVFEWLDQLANTFRISYYGDEADPRGRRAGTILYIAYNHIRLNLNESSLSVPPDYPGIMDYLTTRDVVGAPVISVEKDGSTDTGVWTEYLGTILREWTKRGLNWTTVGRRLVLQYAPDRTVLPTARLSFDDFNNNMEIIRDGAQVATYALATTKRENNVSEGTTVGTGRVGTAYGRIDRIVNINDENVSDAELLEAAREELRGRYPAPLEIVAGRGSSELSPEAPITIDELVPGTRVDVEGDFRFRVSAGFTVTDVEVSWSSGRESVSVGLVPITASSPDDTLPPDE